MDEGDLVVAGGTVAAREAVVIRLFGIPAATAVERPPGGGTRATAVRAAGRHGGRAGAFDVRRLWIQ
ncbi:MULTISPECIES: hypothetical protein [unclassified Streptomyces]|uniref:hypothetical protein n=1 Tax=unclassified Streptomyces TaxID=2593676 RepID=UPI002253384E|nr:MULTISPECIES: hypothetical protein [unclassified Streptomyces]MCX4402597.1 hypothetical protein [Streptomyces sp. NBC_01764]MCX5182430.1 hypothetical protein [Streptomyces sp. NBC_00268]